MKKYILHTLYVLIPCMLAMIWLYKRHHYSVTKEDMMFAETYGAKPYTGNKLILSNEEWKKRLSPEAYYVLREHGTERARTSPLDKIYEPGTYVCAGCDLPVFSSETKFDSGTGWPSFWAPIDPSHVGYSLDRKLFATRVEVHCNRCEGHLGHVFNDGPAPTGHRYCMNGVALKFMSNK